MSNDPFGVGGTWDWLLTDRCTISTPDTSLATFVLGKSIGGFDTAVTTNTTNVPCRLQHDSTGETSAHLRDESTDSYTLYLSDRHNILTGDLITVPYKGAATFFTVQGIATASGIGSGIRKVYLRRVVK